MNRGGEHDGEAPYLSVHGKREPPRFGRASEPWTRSDSVGQTARLPTVANLRYELHVKAVGKGELRSRDSSPDPEFSLDASNATVSNYVMFYTTLRSMNAIKILFLIAFAGICSTAPAETVRYEAQPGGSKMKIDGTSTLHDWTVECAVIGGFMEFDAAFPENAAGAAPSAAKPKVEVIIPVRQLKSGKKGMDAVMHDAMKQEKFPRIEYKMLDLKPKAGAAAGGSKTEFNATGLITVAGVTKTNTMPVTIERVETTRLKVSGATPLKMTDFGIKPPAPEIALGLIKTGDDVKLSFEWLTRKAEQAGKTQ